MLYLILSSEIEVIDVEKGEFRYSPLLKIGYTKDIDSRFDTYLLHNPGCKLLGKREGDTGLESFFHSYYSKYKYPKREEWFYYSQEIIDNFQTLEVGDRYLTKEEYIEGLREFLKSNISTPQELKEKYLDNLLKELGNTEGFDRDFHTSFTMNLWREGYEREMGYIDSYDFYELLKEFPERINLRENPWKNSATFYYRTTADYRKMDVKDFQDIINKKTKSTESLLRSFNNAFDYDKQILAEGYQDLAKLKNYRDDYVAVNKVKNENGITSLKPVLNNLVMVNEIRAFRIQQIDYADRFAVFSTIHDKLTSDDIINQEALEFMEEYNSLTEARKKLIFLCESSLSGRLSKEAAEIVIGQIPDSDYIKSYYTVLGPERLRALEYKRVNIEKALGIVTFSNELLYDSIYSEFKEGEKISLFEIKQHLKNLYSSINYGAAPKASDIGNYFDIKKIKITVDNKRVDGYELIKSKEQELRQDLKYLD